MFSVISSRFCFLSRAAALWLFCSFCAASPGFAGEKRLLVFGDSLSAGYGIAQKEAWPSLLAERLRREYPDYSLVNLSVSGETTSGGRARLPDALSTHRPGIVILELGANDGLRGLPLKQMKGNLGEMIKMAQQGGAKVILLGVRLPGNYGVYARGFAAALDEVAKSHGLPPPPFMMAGFAERLDFFQIDSMHPNAAAQPRILENVWPVLRPFLR